MHQVTSLAMKCFWVASIACPGHCASSSELKAVCVCVDLVNAVQAGFPLAFSSGETHDDFKPQVKATAGQDVFSSIQEDINKNDVFVFMKVWVVPAKP